MSPEKSVWEKLFIGFFLTWLFGGIAAAVVLLALGARGWWIVVIMLGPVGLFFAMFTLFGLANVILGPLLILFVPIKWLWDQIKREANGH